MINELHQTLSEEDIKSRLQKVLTNEDVLPATNNFRRAAVLVPLLCIHNAWHILFTRRTDTVNSHKGQISFPGGAIEPQDDGFENGALRETQEELGIFPKDVHILGRLPHVTTMSGYLITPVVASINWPIKLSLETGEVSRVFFIPYHWLSNPDNYERKTITLMGKTVEGVVFFQPYDGELLWGITAAITIDLISILSTTMNK